MWFKEPLHSKIKILAFLTPKRLLLVFKGMYNNLIYNIRSCNMILEHFVKAHSRKIPISVIFGPKISKSKLMRYHIRWTRDLKLGMDVDIVDSNVHAKIFFLDQPILEVWDINFDCSTPKWPKTEVFWPQEKKFWSKNFSVLIGRSFYNKVTI